MPVHAVFNNLARTVLNKVRTMSSHIDNSTAQHNKHFSQQIIGANKGQW